MQRGRWYAWPSPPKTKRYVQAQQQNRIIPKNPSGEPKVPRPEKGFWAPQPGGQWRRGPKGLRFEWARKEPAGWKEPAKRLHFPPSLLNDDKENGANAQPTAPGPQKQKGLAVAPAAAAAAAAAAPRQPAPKAAAAGRAPLALRQMAPGRVQDTTQAWAYGTQAGHNVRPQATKAQARPLATRKNVVPLAGHPPQPQVQVAGRVWPPPQAGDAAARASNFPPPQPLPRRSSQKSESEGGLCVVM
jgi:hypothetical protein